MDQLRSDAVIKGLLVAVVVCGAFTAVGARPARAQASTSNCMVIGPNMVHCDTMGMGSNASSESGPDGAAELGRGLGLFIARAREDAFRKQVGKLLADGNCQGAARMALESGRLELGQSIMATCGSSRANVPSMPAQTAPTQETIRRF